MVTVLPSVVSVDRAVQDFLRAHAAAPALHRITELVRATFPCLLALDVTLQEDPDDTARTCVLVRAILPASLPDDEYRTSLRLLHERAVRDILPGPLQLFSLVTDFDQG